MGLTTISGEVSADSSYTVKNGDTLSELAQEFSTTVDLLSNNNHIENKNIIFVGQKLNLLNLNPGKQAHSKIGANDFNYVKSEQGVKTQKTRTEQIKRQENVSNSDSNAKEWIANKESGGSYSARNGQYIGRYQLSSSYLQGDYSPANQEKVAEKYVESRYGSWTAAKLFWVANGWY